MTKPSSPSDALPKVEPGSEPDWGLLVSRAQHEEQAHQLAAGEHAPAQGPKLRPRVLAAMASLLLVAGALFAWQGMGTSAGPSPADRDRGRRALLTLIDSSLAEHLRTRGEYPEKLEEVLPLQVDVAYRRTEGGYELSVRLSDGTILTGKKP